MAANPGALAKAILQDAAVSAPKATAGPGGFGGAPRPSGPSPLVASYGEWAGGRTYAAGGAVGLPRDWETFLSGSFGPLSPMQPVPIDAPQPGDDSTAPRRSVYPVSWNLPHGTPGDEGLKLASFAQLRTIADSYSVARSCVQVRIQEILGLGWSIVPTAAAEKKMRGDETARRDFDERRAKIEKFFRKPDPGKYHNFESWFTAVLEEILVVDALSLYLQPPRVKGKGVLGSNLAALCLISGDTIRPMLDMQGGIPQPPNVGYQAYAYGVPRVDLMTALSGEDVAELGEQVVAQYRGDQLLYLPYVSRSWTPYGFPPIERALVPILSGIQRQQYQLGYFSEGSTPGLFVSAGDPNATPQQLRQLQDALNAMAGDPAWKHKIIVLPKDSRIDPMRPVPLADQFDEVVMTQVCMGFDVMPMELGISPRTSTTQSPGAANQMAKASETINARKALKPLLKWLKASIFDYVIQDVFGQHDTQWMWDGFQDGEDEAAVVGRLVNEVGHGLRSIDEARTERGDQAWGLPITSRPVYFTGTGVIPIEQQPAPPGGVPGGGETPTVEPAGGGQEPPVSGASPSPNGKQKPDKKKKNGPKVGLTPAHTGAQAHTTAANTNGGTAQATQTPTTKVAAVLPVNAALRELDLIRRRLAKGRTIDTWQPEHLPVEVFEPMKQTAATNPTEAVNEARTRVRAIGRRQHRDAVLAPIEENITDGLLHLAHAVAAGNLSTIGFIDQAVDLLRTNIHASLTAGVEYARNPTVTKAGSGVTGPRSVDALNGQISTYAEVATNAFEQAYAAFTVADAATPDEVVFVWRARPGACELCAARNGEQYSAEDLPGLPGSGDFGGPICMGGPRCRCELDITHTPPTATGAGVSLPDATALRAALNSENPGEAVNATLENIAVAEAEKQRPYLTGLLQDLLAAITRGFGWIRDWASKRYNPTQVRWPAGSRNGLGGQWMRGAAAGTARHAVRDAARARRNRPPRVSRPEPPAAAVTPEVPAEPVRPALTPVVYTKTKPPAGKLLDDAEDFSYSSSGPVDEYTPDDYEIVEIPAGVTEEGYPDFEYEILDPNGNSLRTVYNYEEAEHFVREHIDLNRPYEEEFTPSPEFRRDLEDAFGGQFGNLRTVVNTYTMEAGELEVEGEIIDADDVRVGEFTRVIGRDGDGLYAEHAFLKLNPRVQGQGFANEFNRMLFDWYRESDVKKVTVHANIDVGGLVWALQGFDFQGGVVPQPIRTRIASYARGWGTANSAIEFKAAEDADGLFTMIAPNGVELPEKYESADAGYRAITRTLAEIPPDGVGSPELRDLLQRIKTAGPGDVTAFDIASVGRTPGAKTWPGAEILLGSSWHGVMWLDTESV